MKTQKHRRWNHNTWETWIFIEFRMWNAGDGKKYVKNGTQNTKI